MELLIYLLKREQNMKKRKAPKKFKSVKKVQKKGFRPACNNE